MKIKTYRSIIKKDPEDTVLSAFQIPVSFIKIPKKTKTISDKYFEVLLETDTKQYQSIPPFHKKSYSYMHATKSKLEQKINKISNALINETDIFTIVSMKLEAAKSES